MKVDVILFLAVVAWIVAGTISLLLAHRAGRTWGFYPEGRRLCRFMVIVQAPALVLDHLWLTTYYALYEGEAWEPMIAPRLLKGLFKNPDLSPEEVLAQMREQDAAK